MVAVTIVRPFTFTHTFAAPGPDGVLPPHATTDDQTMHAKDEYIPVGVHDFPDAMANHWFLRAHSDQPPANVPKPGTPEYGHSQAAAARRRALVEAAIEQEAAEASARIRQEANLSGRVAKVEEEVAAEEAEETARLDQAAAENEAARTGRRVALPPRRGGGNPPAETASTAHPKPVPGDPAA